MVLLYALRRKGYTLQEHFSAAICTCKYTHKDVYIYAHKHAYKCIHKMRIEVTKVG